MRQVKSLQTGVKFKDTPIGKVPVDWEVLSLYQVAEIIMGQSPSSQDCHDYEEGLPFYQGNADFGHKFPIARRWCKKPLKVAKEGDILISVRAPVGEINIAPHECCIGRGLGAIRAIKINSGYLYQSMLFHRKALEKVSQGSTFEAINRKDLSDFLIFAPSDSEQNKIADILSIVDYAIEETDRIIEKTKELKKGLMQRLLTRGIGHKKFKKTEIGEIPEEWGVARLNEAVKEFHNGGTPDTKVKEYWDGNIPWVTGADFINQRISQIRRYITMEGIKNSATNVITKGNLLVVTRTGVGKLAIAPFDIAISQDITGVITDAKRLLPEFLYRFLYCHEKKLKTLAQGTSINGVLREDLALLSICLPPLKEQKEIADILAKVDLEIDHEEANKQILTSLKKSLMQVLLTGKVRVKLH
jgi:type I restriction enzyme S subunit